MRKKSLLLATLMLLVVVLAACGGGGTEPANNNGGNNVNNAAGGEAPEGGADLKIGFVTDEGGINDQSFNQGVWEGLQVCEEEFGVEITYQESNDANDYTPNIETLIDEDCDLILAAGFNLGDAILEAAELNPDRQFAIVDMAYEDGPDNLVGLMFKAQEPSFLVGYIAGHMTETDHVGYVGGQESTLIIEFEAGYLAGVEHAAKELDKEIKTTVQYVGDFSDAAKGKSIAANMFQQGADVIFHAAGGAGDGVIKAAEEADLWAIGVDRDQNDMAPDNVLTSAMKRADVAVYNIVQEMVENDNFPGGTNITNGLEDGETVGIAPTSDKNVPPEILEKIDGIIEQIVAGEIEVPSTREELETFKAGE